jgi:hypothetical protein
MRPLDKPQLRFLGRASLCLAATLTLWWLVLRGPLLDWVRLSTAVLLDAAGGFRAETSVAVRDTGVWVLQAPVPFAAARFRSVKLELPQWVPTVQTVSLPLYWALVLAAGRGRFWWRALIQGSLLLLAIPPFSLLVYAAHVVQRNLYPHSALRIFLDFADYICGTVLPYLAPVLLALVFLPDLRARILTPGPVTRLPAAPGPNQTGISDLKR